MEPLGPGSLACMTCRKRKRRARAICNECYKKHAKRIKAGETTWDAVVAAGLCLAAQPRRLPAECRAVWQEFARIRAAREA